jgi:hypothetical protein
MRCFRLASQSTQSVGGASSWFVMTGFLKSGGAGGRVQRADGNCAAACCTEVRPTALNRQRFHRSNVIAADFTLFFT